MTKSGLDQLLFTHAAMLRRFIAPRIPPRYQSLISPDDVIQSVWTTAMRQIESREEIDLESIESWLLNLAKLRLADQLKHLRSLRRDGQFKKFRLSGIAEQSSVMRQFRQMRDIQRSPSSLVAVGEAATRISEALELLPNDQRRAVRLRYLEGSSADEIASHMGCTVPAARGLVYRGVKSLRKALGDPLRFFSDARGEYRSQ